MPAIAARSERQRVAFVAGSLKARVVAPERRGVGEKEVRHEHGLRRPKMREGRHQRVARGGRLRRQRRDDAANASLQARDAPEQIQPQIDRHLLVARASRVQTPPRVAEPLDELPFDEAVNVLVRAVDKRRVAAPALEDLSQRGLDLTRFVSREHARARERAAPREAPGDVVFEQTAIEAERRAELERFGVRRGIEAARTRG